MNGIILHNMRKNFLIVAFLVAFVIPLTTTVVNARRLQKTTTSSSTSTTATTVSTSPTTSTSTATPTATTTTATTTTTTPTPSATTTPTSTSTAVVSTTPVTAVTNPFAGKTFYTNPNSDAWATVKEWTTTRPADAKLLEQIATQPTARWFGDWNTDVQGSATRYVDKLTTAGMLPVMVAYNIPNRGCDGEGALTSTAYLAWIQSFANGIGSRAAVVILEPDALPAKCFTTERAATLTQAVQIFKKNAATAVYIDAGHSNWLTTQEAASRLNSSGITHADGFSLNVSNFHATAGNATYGNTLSALVGGKHFVIDTGRNGNGSNGETCNPAGRRIGTNPTTVSGYALVDALLWIKPPGESDGTCNGGLSGGGWMAEYALGLVTN